MSSDFPTKPLRAQRKYFVAFRPERRQAGLWDINQIVINTVLKEDEALCR